MSKIDELVAELCPDGVPFVPMWQLTTWDKRFNAVDRHKQPRIEKYRYLLAKELSPLIVDGGDIKILSTNDSDLWTTEQQVDGPIHEAKIIAIPWGGNAIVQYYSGRFVTSDNRIAIANDPNQLDMKFLYYFMSNNIAELASYYRGSGIKHPSMAKVLDWSIPVPPLEIQREIVRILDTFSKMEAELEAELEARKQQYEYYRQHLLSDTEGDSVSLGDIFEMRAGTHIKASDISKEKTDTHPFPCFGGNGVRGFVALNNYDTNAVFVGRQGALCGNVQRFNGEFYATEHAVVVTPKGSVDMSWAFHKLTEMDLNQYKTKSAQPGLAVGKLKD